MTQAGKAGARTGGARASRRVFGALLVVTGLLLVAGAGLAVWRGQPASEFGTDQAARIVTSQPTDRLPAQAAGAGSERVQPEPVPPAELRIPVLGLTAPVDAVGVEPDTGQFEVPEPVDRVGWYRHGPDLDAGAGAIVIAGHVDSAEQGPGAFFRLKDLSAGDVVEAIADDGTAYRFEVVAREVYDKSEIPLERYFARDGQTRLVLITCGGEFDREAGSYRDNVVVTAVPIG